MRGCPWAWSYSSSAAEIGFQRDPHALAWIWPGLPLLSNLAGPIQHFQAALLDAWRYKVLLLIFVGGKVFVAGLCWTSMVLCSSLILLSLRERER